MLRPHAISRHLIPTPQDTEQWIHFEKNVFVSLVKKKYNIPWSVNWCIKKGRNKAWYLKASLSVYNGNAYVCTLFVYSIEFATCISREFKQSGSAFYLSQMCCHIFACILSYLNVLWYLCLRLSYAMNVWFICFVIIVFIKR